MAQDRPTLQELLEAVQDFIDTSTKSTESEQRFNMQVSSYLLSICQREAESGDALNAKVHRELVEFLEHDGNHEALLRELCKDIRDGHCETNTKELFALVRAQTVAKARITRPDHLLEKDR